MTSKDVCTHVSRNFSVSSLIGGKGSSMGASARSPCRYSHISKVHEEITSAERFSQSYGLERGGIERRP